MATLQLLGNTGNINNFFLNEHGMAMGSSLENSITAFGLFYSLLQEKRHSQKQILALQREQTDTLSRLITVQDNERKRIAGDLHDNIGPLLAALKINFSRIINTTEPDLQNALIGKTESIIDDSIGEIRNIALNLMPKGLSLNGLINTLEEYFESIQQVYKRIIVFRHDIQSIPNPDIQINVYRVICELVLNAMKHSHARLITVSIIADQTIITIIINDDGHGFAPKEKYQKKSLGLQNAESRVLYMRGTFSLKTNTGEGTAIEMKIPLQFNEPHVSSF
jgi:signal transduction histidine kinase